MIIFFKKIHNESQPSSKFSTSLMNVVDVFVFRLKVKKIYNVLSKSIVGGGIAKS